VFGRRVEKNVNPASFLRAHGALGRRSTVSLSVGTVKRRKTNYSVDTYLQLLLLEPESIVGIGIFLPPSLVAHILKGEHGQVGTTVSSSDASAVHASLRCSGKFPGLHRRVDSCSEFMRWVLKCEALHWYGGGRSGNYQGP
jgi:hypothetical protein